MKEAIDTLRDILDKEACRLSNLSETESETVPASGKWSKKQILGHLIDSAANNHHRFVRAQLGDALVFPAYSQEQWVSVQNYQSEAWSQLVTLWTSYNRHLAHLMASIPEVKRNRRCFIGNQPPVSLEFLVQDYVRHLRHHLDQILG
ncbi:MAG: DinB family protein [Acidobacteriota bacterium]